MFEALRSFICMVLSFLMGFSTFPLSFFPCKNQADFVIEAGAFSENEILLNSEKTGISVDGNYTFDENGYLVADEKITVHFTEAYCGWFNYYGIAYSSDSAVKGTISYNAGVKEIKEDFFLEKSADEKQFFSFVDGYFKSVKGNKINSITFQPLENESMKIKLSGIAVFNREVVREEVFLSDENYKIGVNLVWGGALSYLEDLDSCVQAVIVDGRTYVDSNAAEKYSAKSVNNNVNLINANDTGRLVQQSYYGIGNSQQYESGIYNDTVWNYNPVQGGNQYNESSKIVDLRIDENSIYIKCRPLDWAKSAEYISPSYMEATYSLKNSLVYVSCRFVDFSGYDAVYTTQEMPAFYCIEPFNSFVYYNEGTLHREDKLIFWPDAGYPNFTSDEHWAAFVGEDENSFGIGLYVPDETNFLAGVFQRESTDSSDPAKASPTSYIALVKHMTFQSFTPIEYGFYLTTGSTEEIRANFSTIE